MKCGKMGQGGRREGGLGVQELGAGGVDGLAPSNGMRVTSHPKHPFEEDTSFKLAPPK